MVSKLRPRNSVLIGLISLSCGCSSQNPENYVGDAATIDQINKSHATFSYQVSSSRIYCRNRISFLVGEPYYYPIFSSSIDRYLARYDSPRGEIEQQIEENLINFLDEIIKLDTIQDINLHKSIFKKMTYYCDKNLNRKIMNNSDQNTISISNVFAMKIQEYALHNYARSGDRYFIDRAYEVIVPGNKFINILSQNTEIENNLPVGHIILLHRQEFYALKAALDGNVDQALIIEKNYRKMIDHSNGLKDRRASWFVKKNEKNICLNGFNQSLQVFSLLRAAQRERYSERANFEIQEIIQRLEKNQNALSTQNFILQYFRKNNL